jgi:2-keto-4-pentenoate hydratase/2-oxohepta-3-ene-1,7-dioic acid hydratase in catechol pathway
MRLLNFYGDDGRRSMGAVEGDRVLDLFTASGQRTEFSSVGAWLRSGDAGAATIADIRKRAMESASRSMPLSGLRHAPLIERDARIFCVGLNYADHAAENNLPPPESPIFFSKLAAVVIPHLAPIPLPAAAANLVDYEAEVAVMIGKRADRVDETTAKSCIAGYSIMNDVSARDLQRSDKQWFRGKNCNGFGPLGPWLATSDEIADPGNMEVTLHVNGELRQHSNTRNLVFPPEKLVSFLSQTLVLEPGDVISTGTPAGIGSTRKPPVFLKAGDRITIEVSGVGKLENVVAAGN